jgi:TP901 family phage tail tape measure protein
VAIGSVLGEMFTDMVYGIGNFFKQAVSSSNEYSDVLANVMRTTNLTTEQVAQLSKELGKIDTRTGRKELLDLAAVAGKLGINAQEDIMGFVRAMDVLTVAMGEDLGGAEEVARKLGKIVEVFNLSSEFGMEDALMRVGSAINQLGMSSTANEGYIVDFTRRLAGIAPLANISVQDIMGMGAALDAMGQTAEVSSTALSKLLVRMAEKKEAFARIAKVELKEFVEMMDKDAGQALLMVLEQVGKTTNGISQLTEVLGDLGTDGGRIVGVLGSMANNIGFVREQQAIANDEFERGTSALEEFAIKNENQAGQWEKNMKRIHAAWMPIRQQIGETAGVALRFFADSIGAILTLVKVLTIGAAAFGIYKTGVVAAYIAKKILNTNIAQFLVLGRSAAATQAAMNAATLQGVGFLRLKRAAVTAYVAITSLLTFRLKTAIAAMSAFNAVTKLNPLGLLVTAVAGAIILFRRWANSVDDVTKAMNTAYEQAVQERVELERLNRAATSDVLSREQRLAAVQKLRDAMPGFLEHLTDEQILTGKASTAIDSYVVALRNKMRAQAFAAVAQEKANDLAKAELDLIRLETEGMTLWENIWNGNINYFIREKKAEIDGLKKEIEEVLNLQTRNENPIPKIKRSGVIGTFKPGFEEPAGEVSTRPDAPDGYVDPGNDSEASKAAAAAQAAREKKLQEYERAKQDYQNFLAEMKAMADKEFAERQGREIAEIQQVEAKYEKLLDKLRGFKEQGIITEDEYDTRYKELIESQNAELLNIRHKFREQEIAELDAFINEFEVKNINSFNDLIIETERYYDYLIAEKQRFNLDYIGLEEQKYRHIEDMQKAHQLALDEINKLSMYNANGVPLGPEAMEKFEEAIDWKKELLQEAYDSDLISYEDMAAEMAALDYQLLQARLGNLDTWQRAVTASADYFSELSANLNQKRINESNTYYSNEINKLKHQYEIGVIDRIQYDDKLRELNEKHDAEIVALRKKQWQREQRIALAEAFINGLVFTLKLGREAGLNGYILGGLLTAANMLLIKSRPMPEFAKGGLLDGPLHSEGGMPIINPRTGRKVAEIEGGEAILSRNTVANNWPLVRALLNSSMNMNGASVMRSITPPPRFEFGGITSTGKAIQPENTSNSTGDLFEVGSKMLTAAQLMMNAALHITNNPLKADVHIGDKELYLLQKEMSELKVITDRSGKR